MKHRFQLLSLALLLATSSAFATPVDPKGSVKMASPKHQNLFVLKVNRTFKKGMVEVYYFNGDLLAITALAKRKMKINFSDVKSGTYIIKVKKKNRVEEFQFVNR